MNTDRSASRISVNRMWISISVRTDQVNHPFGRAAYGLNRSRMSWSDRLDRLDRSANHFDPADFTGPLAPLRAARIKRPGVPVPLECGNSLGRSARQRKVHHVDDG